VILLVGVLAGLIAGYGRALLVGRPYILPAIQRVEIVLLAFLPQALTFFVPQTSELVSQQWIVFLLPISLGILVLFVWYNRQLAGFWLLGLGLLLNLAVISANGGLMPVSPETLKIVHGVQVEAVIGSRALGSKDIVLPVEQTRLEWLGDRFTVPEELPIQFAFSAGDLLLAVGAFWALWVGGAVRQPLGGTFLEAQNYSSQSSSHT
jgi:hypothetical protein